MKRHNNRRDRQTKMAASNRDNEAIYSRRAAAMAAEIERLCSLGTKGAAAKGSEVQHG